MKIVFFGTPQFAVESLKKIYSSKHEIIAVVTAPDKEKGRGLKISYSGVKQFALLHHLKILQPEKLNDEYFVNTLKELNADLFIVVAFRILPQEVFNIPKQGSFNLHGSILPKYRGAAPIQWALIKGERETGVTTFKLEEKVDTGNIYLQKTIEINDDDDFGSLHDRLMVVGADAVIETIEMIESNCYRLIPQNNSLSTSAPKITKDKCKIDWNNPAIEVHNLIRGLSPYPAAFFEHEQKVFKVYKSMVIKKSTTNPGKIHQSKNELIVDCFQDSIKILEIQQEGRKRMSIDEFLRGFQF
jgi:methionyl-tRNA formyltransferase